VNGGIASRVLNLGTLSRLGRFDPRREEASDSVGWLGTRASLDAVEIQPRSSSPYASHYTDGAIPAVVMLYEHFISVCLIALTAILVRGSLFLNLKLFARHIVCSSSVQDLDNYEPF